MFVVWFFYFKFAVDEISETTVDVIKSCLFLSTNKAVALKLQHVEQLNFGVFFAVGAEQEKTSKSSCAAKRTSFSLVLQEFRFNSIFAGICAPLEPAMQSLDPWCFIEQTPSIPFHTQIE